MPFRRFVLAVAALAAGVLPAVAADPPKLNVLFLGDNGHHRPLDRFRQLQPVLAARNIALTYTDRVADLNPDTLGKYDGLVVFANIDAIAPDQEKALLGYVAGGKGFVPLHCASYCFRNSDAVVALVGAQFRSHTTGVFRTTDVAPTHPVMKGFSGFASWDETYVHTKHNEKDRTVLEVRTDGDLKEPWTWVRTHGKGRVFYTAWGHDQRTWGHPGFHNLVERGVRWACGQDPAAAGPYVDRPETTAKRTDVKPFEYTPAKIPLYVPGAGRGGADRADKMQKPLDAAESVKHFVVPKGLEVKPFVTEEKLGGKPIAMTWDERGRLWLSLTADYPNDLKPEGGGRDRIVVCEDTDGDGVCDTVSTFADKLSIPTSLLPFAGGLVVTQAPHTLFLKDTDGDGKADLRQVLFTGWGTNDTHAGPSHLRYGFDNWVYGSVGYSAFAGEVGGERVSFRQGYWRCKLEKDGADPHKLKAAKLEFLRSTSNNTWGFGFAEDGQMFGSTANGCALVHLPIPNRYYEKVKGLTPSVLPPINFDNHIEPITEQVRQVDWHGGFTAAAGCTIYTARTYPPAYWNKTAFVCEPTGHLAATFVLHPTGADYTARYGWNLIASDDEWSAPIDTAVGPDGNVWVLDWYNFIVQHNPTPAGFTNGKGNAYETDLRDKTHGRVYRLTAGGDKPLSLKDASPEKLVETLTHPNLTWRLHAQRLLVGRGKRDVVPAVTALLADRTADSTGLNPGAVHALWTLHGLGALADATLASGVTHPSAAVRKAAVEAGGAAALAQPGAEKLFADASPAVRLAAFLAASAPAAGDALKPVARAAFDPATWADRTLSDAVTIAAGSHPARFLAVLGDVELPAALDPKAVALVESVARQYAAGYDPKATPFPVNKLIGVLARKDRAALREPVVNGLAAGWVSGRTADLADGRSAFDGLVRDLPAGPKARLLKLGTTWGVPGLAEQLAGIVDGLLKSAADAKADPAARLAAAKQVIDFRPDSDDAPAKLLASVNTQTPPEFVAGLFEVLAGSQAKGLGAAVVAKLPDLTPTGRAAALRLVLAKADAAKAFLDAVDAGKVRFDVLALDQKTALSNHPDKKVAERAKKLLASGGGLPDANRQKVIDELHPILAKTGDAANGKKLFFQHCGKCHKHGGEGVQIGPDLTGMAVHPKEELLVHIIDPSRSVEGNYKAFTVQTADGRTLTGLLAAETKTAVELIDAENKRHAIARDDIDSLKESAKSLMPEGFEKQMKPEEMTDLLEFLTQKGKFVPVPLDRVATVVTTKGMFHDEAVLSERMVFPDWKPKTFAGVPFVLVDPQGDRVPNAVMLRGPNGKIPPTMPESVALPFEGKARAVHLLGGVAGWAAQSGRQNGSVSMVVRLRYADGKTEDHPLRDGVEVADYIGKFDVPGSKFAFNLQGKQVRYLSVTPKRPDVPLKGIEFVKGKDRTAPVVMAVTVEGP